MFRALEIALNKNATIFLVESQEDAEALIEWTKDYEARNRADEEALLDEFKDVNVTYFTPERSE